MTIPDYFRVIACEGDFTIFFSFPTPTTLSLNMH
jgi:hypothetical protein